MAQTSPGLIDRIAPITRGDLHRLRQHQDGHCVSVYVPTERGFDKADANRIRFKDAVRDVEHALAQSDLADDDQAGLLDPLRQVAQDDAFWRAQHDGLAVFVTADWARGYRLNQAVPAFTGFARSFHIKPLIRLLQADDRYQVLAVTTKRVALYAGGRDIIEEVQLHPDVPKNMAEAIGAPARVSRPISTDDAQLVNSDKRDEQLRVYFERIDRPVHDHHSRLASVPLILAAPTEYHSFFHEASTNPHLLETGIRRHPFKDMTERQLRELAWQVFEPQRRARIEELTERFHNAAAHQKGWSDLEAAAEAAAYGKIGTLLLDADRRLGGTIDPDSGRVAQGPLEGAGANDALDDLAELVLDHGGEVLVVSPAEHPTDTGLAAIGRY